MTIKHLLCKLTGGHSRLTHLEPGRVSLKCTDCGHQTRGWDLDRPRPKVVPIRGHVRLRIRRTA
jgi:hypothetical protein